MVYGQKHVKINISKVQMTLLYKVTFLILMVLTIGIY